MRNVKTRAHVGRDGKLKLEISTELVETDLDVIVVYQPVESTEQGRTEALGWPVEFFKSTAGAVERRPAGAGTAR